MRIPIFIFSIFSLSFLSTSCIKDEYPAKGVLVQYDARLCACCGGIFINLNNTDTVNAATKIVNSLPSDFIFTADEFPLRVQFAWENGGGCLPNNIIVTKIKRR